MDKQKLSNPLFIFSVVILVINDWVLKYAFHNMLTGKLSDFAGLFALPFFLSALYPKWTRSFYILTAFLFIVWKTPFIQPLIDAINDFGIPIGRTVDYTDYISLAILPFSFFSFKKSAYYSLKPVLLNLILIISSIAFLATSRDTSGDPEMFTNINKTYPFNFSKRELVAKLNMVQLEAFIKQNKANIADIDFNEETNTFHYKDENDTLALLLDYRKINDVDTIAFRTSYAKINISGDNNSSKLRLINISNLFHPSPNLFQSESDNKDFKGETLKLFEEDIIQKIKKY